MCLLLCSKTLPDNILNSWFTQNWGSGSCLGLKSTLLLFSKSFHHVFLKQYLMTGIKSGQKKENSYRAQNIVDRSSARTRGT